MSSNLVSLSWAFELSPFSGSFCSIHQLTCWWFALLHGFWFLWWSFHFRTVRAFVESHCLKVSHECSDFETSSIVTIMRCWLTPSLAKPTPEEGSRTWEVSLHVYGPRHCWGAPGCAELGIYQSRHNSRLTNPIWDSSASRCKPQNWKRFPKKTELHICYWTISPHG